VGRGKICENIREKKKIDTQETQTES